MQTRFNPLTPPLAPRPVAPTPNPSAPPPPAARKTKSKAKAKTRRAPLSATNQEALARAQNETSLANYPTIYQEFARRGIPASEILPRENVLTFRAWLAKGRCVKKGEHGVRIATCVPITKNLGGDPVTGEPKIEVRTRPGAAIVFHISQTTPLDQARAARAANILDVRFAPEPAAAIPVPNPQPPTLNSQPPTTPPPSDPNNSDPAPRPGAILPTLQRLINLFGGLDALRAAQFHSTPNARGETNLRIDEIPHFMRLVIEYVADPAIISVAHYYEQNGDLMRDPEITFKVDTATTPADPFWRFIPTTFTQDNIGLYQDEDAMTGRQLRECTAFAKQWDTNLRDQGYLQAYEKRVTKPTPPPAPARSSWLAKYQARKQQNP